MKCDELNENPKESANKQLDWCETWCGIYLSFLSGIFRISIYRF